MYKRHVYMKTNDTISINDIPNELAIKFVKFCQS